MKISVITPVYNAEGTLKRTILSVLGQKIDAEIEYILIDGGSNDRSLEIINNYDKINIVISEKDKGVYDAMNKGIACATGDIIGIINADDWYNDGAFISVGKVFDDNPNVDITYSPINNYYNGQYLNTFTPGALENLVFKFTINHPSCFVKRSVYEKIGHFDLNYSIAADYDFIFRAYSSGFSFRYIEQPLVSYSLNGMSGKPLSKFKQIQESWKVGASAAQASPSLQQRRQQFYRNWFFKEVVTLPLKPILDPHTSRKMKGLLRSVMGGELPSDKYGAW